MNKNMLIKTKTFMLLGLFCFLSVSARAQSFSLGWEGNDIIPSSLFLDVSAWNTGAAEGDYLTVTTDLEAIHLHWKFGSGNRNKWVVYYISLNSPISITNFDIIGLDVKGSVCKSNRDFSLKFEDGTNQAVFFSHGLASIVRWVNRISIPQKQFSGNPDWNNIKVIAFAISSDASSEDLLPDSGTVSIRNLKIANMDLWQRATTYETLTQSDFLDSVKNKALQGILERQVPNGLLYSWREDNASWLYGQGLVLKLLSIEGIWENKVAVNDYAKAAEKLARFLAGQQFTAGYWPRGWNTLQGTVRSVDEVIWMGDFPWIITGLVNYYAKSGDENVFPAIQKAKTFLYDLIEPSGKFYTVNTSTGEKILVTNTEAYTAAINSVFELGDTATATTMLQYISSSTWDDHLLYWKEAIESSRPTLFSATWMAMLSYHTNDSIKAINSLSFVGKVLDTHGPGNPEGFDGIGPIATWYEGTLSYICAGGSKSQMLFDSLVNYRFADGTIPSYNDSLGGKADIWAVDWSSLDATSWLYFAAAKKSPFKQYHSFSFSSGLNENEVAIKTPISIFPVPAKEKITITLNDVTETIRSIAIYNILGQSLIKKTINPGSKVEIVDISFLSTGIYICLIEGQTQLYSQKIEIIK
ncbi:MAG: T9SS type A sorting domain-containing protein [Ignavibacteriales bacterium]|nr:T9SS type A sorting domain-containing protein [Ignavibacteriales bacterium]